MAWKFLENRTEYPYSMRQERNFISSNFLPNTIATLVSTGIGKIYNTTGAIGAANVPLDPRKADLRNLEGIITITTHLLRPLNIEG